jgi:uncharacterized glyoxalase superfamily protein PhnB
VKPTDRVTATVDVAVDPETAFRIFTEEIDAWWDRGPANFYDGGRALAMRFEPGVGGRYLEVYNDATGDALEIGRITVWEPGRRFVYRSSLDDTEVEIRFEAIDGGTRVSLEQRLVSGGKTAHFLSGWHNILTWFADLAERPAGESPPKDLPRICPVLHYADVPAAAQWLHRAFGLRPRRRMQNAVTLGNSVVMLSQRQGPSTAADATSHSIYVYVDNLEEHFAAAQAAGATILEPIRKHGDRRYIAADLEGHRWTFAQSRPTQR